jgi:hypothetical protein
MFKFSSISRALALLTLASMASPSFAGYDYRVPLKGIIVSATTCETPWGATLQNGGQATGFATETLPHGSACAPIQVTCMDGALSNATVKFASRTTLGPVFDNTWNAATKGTYDAMISPLVIETTGNAANWTGSTTIYGASEPRAMSAKSRTSGKWHFEVSATGLGYLRAGLASAPGALFQGYLNPTGAKPSWVLRLA